MYTFLIFYSEFSCDASKKFSFCPFRDKKKKKEAQIAEYPGDPTLDSKPGFPLGAVAASPLPTWRAATLL